jgi:hypothetical protein
MGILEDRSTGRRHTLASRCLLGRHPACDLRFEDPRISGEHASVRWLNGGWELRDLGSRNGTFLDRRRLAVGERVPLCAGRAFSLGSPKVELILADAAPPGASARRRGTGAGRVAIDGLLVLPDDARPLVTIFEDDAGRWVAEIGDERRRLSDQEVLDVGGEAWIVELPLLTTVTFQSGGTGPLLEQAHLRFAVRRDEEEVQIAVQVRGQTTLLPHRSHHYLLVTLARARLADSAAPEGERGWLAREDLCRMLAMDPARLSVEIYRARRQMMGLGLVGGAEVVQRRAATGELRLGAPSFEVVPLDG